MHRSPQSNPRNWLLAIAALGLGGCPVDGRILLEDHGASSTSGALGTSGTTGARDSGSSGNAGLGGAAARGGSGFDANANGGTSAGRDGGNSGGGANRGGTTGSSGNEGSGGNDGSADSGGSSGAGGSTGSGGATGGGGLTGNAGCWDVDEVAQWCGPNLVRNSGFDLDANDWKAETTLVQHWDPRDARGGTDSGALSILNGNAIDAGSPGLTMVGTTQCLEVTGKTTYALGARLFIPGRQGEGHAAVNIWSYADPGCTGAFLEATTPAFVSTVDAWHVANAHVKTSPATRSLRVRLVAVKPFTQPALEVLFDDVVFRSDPRGLTE